MTNKKEGEKTNWYNEIHVKLIRKADGFVEFKIAKNTYTMRYETFIKVSKKLKDDYNYWKWKKVHKKKYNEDLRPYIK